MPGHAENQRAPPHRLRVQGPPPFQKSLSPRTLTLLLPVSSTLSLLFRAYRVCRLIRLIGFIGFIGLIVFIGFIGFYRVL